MRKQQIVAVFVLVVVIGAAGLVAQQASSSIKDTIISGTVAGSEGNDILNVPLNPEYGMHYRCEITSSDGRAFSVLFTNLSELMDARLSGAPIDHDAGRSALNVTSVTLEGQLPDNSDVYQLLIVSAEAGATVHISASGDQGPFPPSLGPVLQAATFICWISNIFLFFLLIHVYGRYRNERRPGY